MGDAFSLAELRSIIFAVCVISFFAALVGWMPQSFNYTEARQKIEVPTNLFSGMDLVRYTDFHVVNLTTTFEYENNTGGHDWKIDARYGGGQDCIALTWIWKTAWSYSEMGTFKWYNVDGELVSTQATYGEWCYLKRFLSTDHYLTSAALNAAYDPITKLARFRVIEIWQGTVKFDIAFAFTGPYTTPLEAWIAGDLQMLVGLDYSDANSYNGGITMLLGLLTFQKLNGIPIYIEYLIGGFLWALIITIGIFLVLRIIPFL